MLIPTTTSTVRYIVTSGRAVKRSALAAIAVSIVGFVGCSDSPSDIVTTEATDLLRETDIPEVLTREQLAELERIDDQLAAETQRAAMAAAGENPDDLPADHLRFIGPNGTVLVAIEDLPSLRAEADAAARERLGVGATEKFEFAFGIRGDGNYGVVAVFRCEPDPEEQGRNICREEPDLSAVVRRTADAARPR